MIQLHDKKFEVFIAEEEINFAIEAMAKQIAMTAKAFIKNRGGNLEDWLRIFADEDIVISKLKAL